MLIRHLLEEMPHDRFWCETCLMSFPYISLDKGHMWNWHIQQVSNSRTDPRIRSLYPRPTRKTQKPS